MRKKRRNAKAKKGERASCQIFFKKGDKAESEKKKKEKKKGKKGEVVLCF